MRITISHKKTKTEVVESVNRSFDQLFQGVAGIPVRVVVEQKNWQGSTLSFLVTAKMGLMSTPIRGTVEVTDHDVSVEADLGLLEKLVPAETVRDVMGRQIKGLLE